MIRNEIERRNRINVILVSLASLIAGLLFSRTTADHDFVLAASGALVGLAIGCPIVLLETYLSPKISKRFSFIVTIIIKNILYSFIILSTLTLNIFILISSGYYDMTLSTHLSQDSFKTSVLFSIVLTLFFITMFQINDLIGRGVLLKFFLGRYHSPREEERIFMFLDLKNSTGIAETLGDKKFLSLINDFFYDLTNPVLLTGGEIYKYVGDEAILTWSFKKGIKGGSAIKSFFIFRDILKGKREYYLSNYGIIPEFKAGIHGGYVVTGEIGLSKKEITYLGDILNTTARIEGLCNKLGEDFLISEDLFDRVDNRDMFVSRKYENITLRGKQDSTTLYSLDIK